MHTIHPSVIMNISEHHSRTRGEVIIIGALLGKKKDIMDSFELRTQKDSTSEIDIEFFNTRSSLIKQVSPDLDIIGWYSTIFNQQLHEQIKNKLIQNPIFVRLDPHKRNQRIPLSMYETKDDMTLDEIKWTIVTEDIEIIGLDTVKMPHVNLAAPSAAVDNLMAQKSAVQMLRDRIKEISKYVKDVQSSKAPYNEEIINSIANLCKRFPILNVSQYNQAYNIQCNDVALNTYLGIMAKGSIGKMNFGEYKNVNSKTRAYSSTHARK